MIQDSAMLLQRTLFLSFSWLSGIPLYIHHIFIHSSGDGHSGFVSIVAVVNSTAVNFGVHVSFHISVKSVFLASSLLSRVGMNFTNFQSPSGKGSKEVGHPSLQVWFFSLRENVQTQGCPRPSIWWARSAWLPSTCHFMWALCPQVRRGPLPGPGLERRISWHSSWMSQCSLPAKRALLSWTQSLVSSASAMSWLDLENSDTASHTQLVYTRPRSPGQGERGGKDWTLLLYLFTPISSSYLSRRLGICVSIL